MGEASEQNGGGIGTCYLCLVLCHLVIHPAVPRTWRASERRTLTWGPAQTRAPCPLFLMSAEIQSDFIHLPREPRFLRGEATSRVWDLAEGRGNLLSDTQTASLAHAAVCDRAKAKLPIKTIALRTFPEAISSDLFVSWRIKLRPPGVITGPTCCGTQVKCIFSLRHKGSL